MRMLKLTDHMDAFPTQIWLEIFPGQASANHYSNDIAARNAHLSRLCLNTVLEWLQTEADLNTDFALIPSESNLPSLWELLPGVVIQLDQTRLALIPSETVDPDQFCVPFEWVDIPNWAADYYLAIQMDLEEEPRLRIWGFTTHQALKAGTVDSIKRLYKLDREAITENLNVFWVMRSLNATPPKAPLSPLPTLTLDQLEALLNQLGQPTLYSPRLEVHFEQWAAVIANDQWRNLLFQKRQPVLAAPIDLRQWFQQAIDETWQALESLILPAQSMATRGMSQSDGMESITPILRLMQSAESEQIRQQAAGILGEIGSEHPEAVTALVNLVETAQKEETRWQAALSLGKIAPNHPLAGVRRARLIDLGLQLEQHSVALVVAIMPKTSDRIGVFLQVQSANPQVNLPPHLKVSVLSESGETRLQAEARQDERSRGKDQSLDLRFSPPAGSRFQIKVELNQAAVIEEFLA
jgi:Protein of unknown function (DUF1822)